MKNHKLSASTFGEIRLKSNLRCCDLSDSLKAGSPEEVTFYAAVNCREKLRTDLMIDSSGGSVDNDMCGYTWTSEVAGNMESQ